MKNTGKLKSGRSRPSSVLWTSVSSRSSTSVFRLHARVCGRCEEAAHDTRGAGGFCAA